MEVSRRRILAVWLLIPVLLSGCGGGSKRSTVQLGYFDTVTQITAYAPSQAAFDRSAGLVVDEIARLHRIFDAFAACEDGNNVFAVNAQAGLSPVAVPPELAELVALGLEWHELSGGTVNIAIGALTGLWREALAQGAVPDQAAITQALALCDINDVILDREAGTVYLAKPGMRLDLGAVAKGYAAGLAAQAADRPVLLNMGGNIAATGVPKKRADWSVGIQHPDGADTGELLPVTLGLTSGAVVTSGDYQRYTEIGGMRYHHLLDPATGTPARLYRSVTVTGADSGLCDMLSTALFMLPIEQGEALARELDCKAIWVLPDLSIVQSEP